MPINGLEIANQSGSASRNGSTSRLCARALATGKNVADPAAKGFGVPVATSRELIIFMLSSYRWRPRRGYCASVGFCNATLESIHAASFG
jgi:hypothetical protein